MAPRHPWGQPHGHASQQVARGDLRGWWDYETWGRSKAGWTRVKAFVYDNPPPYGLGVHARGT